MELKNLSIALCVVALSACGGSGNNAPEEEVVEPVIPDSYGQLIDSNIIGIRVVSGDYEGFTDENGTFGYLEGELVQFFVGDIAVGNAIEPKSLLTPIDLAENDTYAAFNIARFVQSLDDDANPENGIQIHESSHDYAQNQSLDFLSNEWDITEPENSSIEQLIYALTADTSAGARYSVPTTSTYEHFSETLNGFIAELENDIRENLDITGCTSDSQCKVFILPTSFVGYCPPLDEKLVYSEPSTDIAGVELLSEQRNTWIETKSELYYLAEYPPTYGLCTYFEEPRYSACNDEGSCEFRTGIPIG